MITNNLFLTHYVFMPVMAFLSGALTIFGMPPYNNSLCGILGYAGLFLILLLKEGRYRKAVHCWHWGMGFYLHGLYWVANAITMSGPQFAWAYPIALFGFPAFMALFPTLLTFFSSKAVREKPLFLQILFFITLFSVIEWLRSFILTGFPWHLPAYIWSDNLPILQSLSLIGPFGLSLLTLMFSGLLAYTLIMAVRSRFAIKTVVAMLILYIGFYGFGTIRLNTAKTGHMEEYQARIIQPNVDFKYKWDPAYYNEHIDILESLLTLDEEKTSSDNLKIIHILPETALNSRLLSNTVGVGRFFNLFSSYPNQYLLTGYLTDQKQANSRQMDYYNSALILDDQMTLLGRFDKSHLVPFGEYIPYNNILPLESLVHIEGFKAGHGPQTFTIDDRLRVSFAICYEIIFPASHFKTKERPNIIINITNDSWYKDGAGPEQHFMMARYRAIEYGIPVLRSANTGISGGFDGYGLITSKIIYGKRDVVEQTIPKVLNTTFYSQLKEIPYFIVVFALLSYIFSNLFRKNQKKHT